MTNGKEQRSLWLHRWMWLVSDAAIWFAAIYGATWLRYDFVDPAVLGSATLTFAAAATVTYLVVGVVIGPYAVEHRRGSFEETANLSGTVLATASTLLVWAFVANPLIVPRSVPVMAGALALVSMFAARFFIRSWRSAHAATGEDDRRVIVFGAGEAGRLLLRNMMQDPESGFFPVAILDDDRAVLNLVTSHKSPPIALQPWGGLTVSSLLEALGSRSPVQIPPMIAKTVCHGLAEAGRVHASAASQERRLEMLWFGQAQTRTWLEDHGWDTSPDLLRWQTVAAEFRSEEMTAHV